MSREDAEARLAEQAATIRQQRNRCEEAEARLVGQAAVIRQQRDKPLMRQVDRLTWQNRLLEAFVAQVVGAPQAARMNEEAAEQALARYPVE